MPVNLIGDGGRYLQTIQFPERGQALPGVRTAPDIAPRVAKSDDASAAGSFADALTRALGQVNSLHVEADRQAELLATGRAENPHDAVLALEKADLALQLTLKITEKAIGAYRQLSQMQV
jgi:flagellar hook-basal body complex protein FliE